jgi:hypothetical protein
MYFLTSKASFLRIKKVLKDWFRFHGRFENVWTVEFDRKLFLLFLINFQFFHQFSIFFLQYSNQPCLTTIPLNPSWIAQLN